MADNVHGAGTYFNKRTQISTTGEWVNNIFDKEIQSE